MDITEFCTKSKQGKIESILLNFFTWLEAGAGTKYAYLLVQVLGSGLVVTKSRATIYVTKCAAISVEPRAAANCTQEIPVKLNETNAFVDPISFVIRYVSTKIHCNEIALPRYQIVRIFVVFQLSSHVGVCCPDPIGIKEMSEANLTGLRCSIPRSR